MPSKEFDINNRGRKQPPKYQLLANDLRGAIEAGGYSVNDRMPAEAKLATTYGVSTRTVRKAFETLFGTGHLRSDGARGTFVSQPINDSSTESAGKEVSSLNTARKKQTMPQILAKEIYTGIISGDHPPGEKLPSYAQLRRTHNVSQKTARGAFDILGGLVVFEKGTGYKVVDSDAMPQQEVLISIAQRFTPPEPSPLDAAYIEPAFRNLDSQLRRTTYQLYLLIRNGNLLPGQHVTNEYLIGILEEKPKASTLNGALKILQKHELLTRHSSAGTKIKDQLPSDEYLLALNEVLKPKSVRDTEVATSERQESMTYRRVTKELIARIEKGTYPSDRLLPSVKAIEQEFDVSIDVARSAVWHLVQIGFATVEKREGILLVTPQPAEMRVQTEVKDTTIDYPREKILAFNILQKIRSGEYPPGSRLPFSQEELGAKYDMSRAAVSRSFKLLPDIFESRSSKFCRVTRDLPDNNTLDHLATSLQPPNPDDAPPLVTAALDLLFTDHNILSRNVTYEAYLMIRDGRLAPGEKIPNDLDWSGISSGTPTESMIRQAFTILKNLGLLQRRSAVGSSVVNPLPSTVYMDELDKALAPAKTKKRVPSKRAGKQPSVQKEESTTPSGKSEADKQAPIPTPQRRKGSPFIPRPSEIIALTKPPSEGLREADPRDPWAIEVRKNGDTPLVETTTHLRTPSAFIKKLLQLPATGELQEIRKRKFIQTTSTPEDIKTSLHNLDIYYIPVPWLLGIKFALPDNLNSPLLNVVKLAQTRDYQHQTILENADPKLAEMFAIQDNAPLLVHIFTYYRNEKPFAARILTQPRDRNAKPIFFPNSK
jgi:DNA-binding GntR family transcriptional regulator